MKMFQRYASRLFASNPVSAAVSSMSAQRALHPIAGPPRNPLTTAELFILGGGFMVTIMLIPLWGIYSVPRWAKIHKGEDEKSKK